MSGSGARERRAFLLHGAVQGVGFRPFVHRLATQLGLAGWTANSERGLEIEVEGSGGAIEGFRRRLADERPALARVTGCEERALDPVGDEAFRIRESVGTERRVFVQADIATCDDCLAEIRDPAARRYRYAFATCVVCGPRFSILERLPYDREHTTLRAFPMCEACLAEYTDAGDRRFHAQAFACPACGPALELWDRAGRALAREDEALLAACAALERGAVVAVKGLGGFHLMVDAASEIAVRGLRARKRRGTKPFALMFRDLAALRAHAMVSPLEEEALRSPQAPIVLLRARADRDATTPALAPSVSPGTPLVGAMLPATPLHHLMLAELGGPVVATSGNLSEEPIVTDERVALERLGAIADLFLVHDRPIAHHVDDSIVRVVCGRALLLRRARGYAPLPIAPAWLGGAEADPTMLAVGAHQKSTVAVAAGPDLFVSQHIGDLGTPEAVAVFGATLERTRLFHDGAPALVAHDLHPDYASTIEARRLGAPTLAVQHHHAHVLACLADNDAPPPALGVSWDGNGLGTDGSLWGGELLAVTRDGFRRVAHLRSFPLPGGDRAAHEPRRSALGLLHAHLGAAALDLGDLAPLASFTATERRALGSMLRAGVNAPASSSVGRLFDAVASLAGIAQRVEHEGEAAMALEMCLQGDASAAPDPYPWTLRDDGAAGAWVVDWAPMLDALLAELRAGARTSHVAERFHDTLADIAAAVAVRHGDRRVALAGGCFQNAALLTRCVARLEAEGHEVLWPRELPPNDGAIALGQLVAGRLQGVPS